MLIPNWRRAWRMLSIQVAGLATALWGAWLAATPEQQAAVIEFIGLDPSRWGPLVAFAGFVVARLVAQPAVTPPTEGS